MPKSGSSQAQRQRLLAAPLERSPAALNHRSLLPAETRSKGIAKSPHCSSVSASSGTCPLNQVHLLLEERKATFGKTREAKHRRRRSSETTTTTPSANSPPLPNQQQHIDPGESWSTTSISILHLISFSSLLLPNIPLLSMNVQHPFVSNNTICSEYCHYERRPAPGSLAASGAGYNLFVT